MLLYVLAAIKTHQLEAPCPSSLLLYDRHKTVSDITNWRRDGLSSRGSVCVLLTCECVSSEVCVAVFVLAMVC